MTPEDRIARAARVAAALTRAHGGVTLRAADLVPVEPESGYAVGGYAPSIILSASATDRDIAAAIGRMRATHRPGAAYIGTWRSGGRVYIDAVAILADRENAIAAGRERGERAVFDFAASAEVTL